MSKFYMYYPACSAGFNLNLNLNLNLDLNLNFDLDLDIDLDFDPSFGSTRFQGVRVFNQFTD